MCICPLPKHTSALNIWQVVSVSSLSIRSMILNGIWLSAPQGTYCILSLIHTGATSCSSLNTSEVLGENAAAARAPGMARTVNVLSV